VDASILGWGAVLSQELGKDRRPCRFESGVWTNAEQKYDATKRECRGVLCALRRMRNMLYGAHFILETDAMVLVHQLNGAASDVPGSLIMRWIAWIRLFDFEVRHVPGPKNIVADSLSRKPPGLSDSIDQDNESDIDERVDSDLNQVKGISAEDNKAYLDGDWPEEYEKIAQYLSTLMLPPGLNSRTARRRFKDNALRFAVQDRTLWRRATSNYPRRRVIANQAEKIKILRALHEDLDHKRGEILFRRTATRYWWEGMWNDVKNSVKACPRCQKAANRRPFEPIVSSKASWPFAKVHIDVTHMPKDQGKRFIVEARCALTSYVVARAIPRATAKYLRDFFWEDICCVYGLPLKVVVDGGSENKAELERLLSDLGVRRVVLSAYNPQANGIVEGGHYLISFALTKILDGKGVGWVNRLPAVLLADRTAIRSSHGYPPFYLLFGYDPVLPIEVDIPTWRILNWDSASQPEDLIRLRVRMLERRHEDIEAAVAHVNAYRAGIKKRIDKENRHRLRAGKLQAGDLVLIYDSPGELDKSSIRKLMWKWNGPYRIADVGENKSYQISTLDGIPVSGSFPPHRIKAFVKDKEGWWTSMDDFTLLSSPDTVGPGHNLRSQQERLNTSSDESSDELSDGRQDGNSRASEDTIKTRSQAYVKRPDPETVDWELVDGPPQGRPIEVVIERHI